MDDNTEQTTEVRERDVVTDRGDRVSRRTVATDGVSTADTRVVMSRAAWYIAGFIIALLALRVLLLMLGANRDSGFVDFVYALSGVFAAPFVNIFPAPTYGQFFFDTASVVAIVVYALIAWGISKLFTLSRPAGSADV